MWLFYKKIMLDLDGAEIQLVGEDKVIKQDPYVSVKTLRGNRLSLHTKHPKVLFKLIKDRLLTGAVGFEVTEKEIQEYYDANEHVDLVEGEC